MCALITLDDFCYSWMQVNLNLTCLIHVYCYIGADDPHDRSSHWRDWCSGITILYIWCRAKYYEEYKICVILHSLILYSKQNFNLTDWWFKDPNLNCNGIKVTEASIWVTPPFLYNFKQINYQLSYFKRYSWVKGELIFNCL